MYFRENTVQKSVSVEILRKFSPEHLCPPYKREIKSSCYIMPYPTSGKNYVKNDFVSKTVLVLKAHRRLITESIVFDCDPSIANYSKSLVTLTIQNLFKDN